MGVTINGMPGVCSPFPGRTDVFALGSDGKLWHRYYNEGEGWFSWESFDGLGAVTAPTASSSVTGRMDIFATNKDGALIHWWYVEGGKPGWNGPENMGTIKQ